MFKSQRAELLQGEVAVAVADVLETAAELRQASDAYLALQRKEPDPYTLAAADRHARARAYIVELTGRIFSRARSAGMEGRELLCLANLTLDGKRRLPREYQEAA